MTHKIQIFRNHLDSFPFMYYCNEIFPLKEHDTVEINNELKVDDDNKRQVGSYQIKLFKY